MRKNLLLAAAAVLVTISSVPAFAADYYIVREGSTGPCRVVESKPTDSKMVIVGGDKMYTTREEAETEMKVVCKGD